MRKLIFISLLYSLVCGFILPQESKIKGRYEMQFEEEFVSHNCMVNFDGSVYKRKLSNGKIIKGTIEYSNQKILLNDKNTFLQMEFYKEEMPNDTIYFKTSDIRKESNDNKGEIIIYSGKLIRKK
jgi:tRNA G26 N,N-dimethylase Trm1